MVSGLYCLASAQMANLMLVTGSFLVGKVESGETLFAALSRELQEEIDVAY